jgi:serine protease AprX
MNKHILLSHALGLLLIFTYGRGQSLPPIEELATVSHYQDVRLKDLRKIEQQLDSSIIKTFWLHESTLWPEKFKSYVHSVLEKGKNPGLGVRGLHKQGITGKGVTVAIIDQNMCLDHPEFAGKIIEYKDIGTKAPMGAGSMHGPAVTSLLVGETIGTAPGARLYYVAVPTWKMDAQYEADALSWLIEKNKILPDSSKIRVVSVSARPSGPKSEFTKNNSSWDSAFTCANEAGILVLDCTGTHGITTYCFYDLDDPDNISKCTPGEPSGLNKPDSTHLCVPMSCRTQAEEYNLGICSYQYTGQGGLSWTAPYVAGICALGWQINPSLSGETIVKLLRSSAYVEENGMKIIQPTAFIDSVRALK